MAHDTIVSEQEGTATRRSTTSSRVSAVLGSMSIPEPLGVTASREAIDYFLSAEYDEVDTAILYQEGRTELALGEIGMERCRVATKANPWYSGLGTHSYFTPTHGLRPDWVKEQLRMSIKNLGAESVDLFYLHAPDRNTPLAETLKAVHELRMEGLFQRWGLSNYAAWEVVDIWHMCKSRGWQTPSVYQGMYNAITRDVERELLPALKRLGMRFYAYNPLAGGILVGKHSFDNPPNRGRFDRNTLSGAMYMKRYWYKAVFDAIDEVKALCQKYDTDMVSTSIRWLCHHSSLSGEDGDAVIICGSSVNQVKADVDACADETPLPQDMVEAYDRAWETCKMHCPSYFK